MKYMLLASTVCAFDLIYIEDSFDDPEGITMEVPNEIIRVLYSNIDSVKTESNNSCLYEGADGYMYLESKYLKFTIPFQSIKTFAICQKIDSINSLVIYPNKKIYFWMERMLKEKKYITFN